jgi:hypothetical protein
VIRFGLGADLGGTPDEALRTEDAYRSSHGRRSSSGASLYDVRVAEVSFFTGSSMVRQVHG